MVAARSISLTLIGVMLAALAGCATTHGRLTRSADRLERNASAFASDARYASDTVAANSEVSRDARDLADQADEFRHTVNDSRADDRDVQNAFDRLSRSYHTLRDDVDHSGSPQAMADMRPVTQAYLDVEGDMGGYPSHRYAEDEDRSER